MVATNKIRTENQLSSRAPVLASPAKMTDWRSRIENEGLGDMRWEEKRPVIRFVACVCLSRFKLRSARGSAVVLGVLVAFHSTVALAQVLRLAAYNVDADTPPSGGCSTPIASGCQDAGPGLPDVLKAIGQSQFV